MSGKSFKIDMKPKISVIIPIYNVEQYLEECLNSVIEQTFKDIEIILVDDGSTDRSSEIIRNFAKRDKRVIFCSQTHQGVSVARNTGIRQAKGKYMLFVDSDDKIIQIDCLKILYQNVIETNSDLVLGNAAYWYPDGSVLSAFNRGVMNNISGLPGEICFERLMENLAFPPLVYLFFVKRELIIDNKLFFKRNIIHEDELWCVKTMFYSRRVSLIDLNYYLYRQREGSIMHSNNNVFRIKSILTVSNELRQFASGLNEKNIPKNIVGFIYVRIFIQYNVIGRLITNEDYRLLSKTGFYSMLLIEIYTSLDYSQQKYCLDLYRKTALSILNKN